MRSDQYARTLDLLDGVTEWRLLRILVTASVVLAYLLMALLDERPLHMLVGGAPLALLAAETVWHLLDDIESANKLD